MPTGHPEHRERSANRSSEGTCSHSSWLSLSQAMAGVPSFFSRTRDMVTASALCHLSQATINVEDITLCSSQWRPHRQTRLDQQLQSWSQTQE